MDPPKINLMRFYFAPLMGVANHVYRKTHASMFGRDIDKYYTPFFSPHIGRTLDQKDRKILTESMSMYTVPQILTNSAKDYLRMEQGMLAMGFHEININVGCPSPTVIGKNRGSGFLRNPDHLHHFLEEIYKRGKAEITVKTRIGFESPDEFPKLLDIYNEYPMKELIIHPRTGRQVYQGSVDLDAFYYAMEHSKNPLCYNGDIFSLEDFKKLKASFSERADASAEGRVVAVMAGRGLISNPALLRELAGGDSLSMEELLAFLMELRENYRTDFSKYNDGLILRKMKEVWKYLKSYFIRQNNVLDATQIDKVFYCHSLEEYLSWEEKFFVTVHPQT